MFGFKSHGTHPATAVDMIAEDVFKPLVQLDAELADTYETLLDVIWRQEREWLLDDRIQYSCAHWPHS